VVDTLCDWAIRQNAAVGFFYFDLAAQKEQSLTNDLNSLLRQVVGGLEDIPVTIAKAFQDRRGVIKDTTTERKCRDVGKISHPHGPPLSALILWTSSGRSIRQSYLIY